MSRPKPLQYIYGRLEDQIAELFARLEAQEITVEEWQSEMESLIAKHMMASYLAGEGADALTPDGYEYLKEAIANQFDYLGAFAKLMAFTLGAAGIWQFIGDNNEVKLRWNGWRARAQMYAGSVVEPYWQGYGGILPLPALPGDGTSQCLTHCKCRWRIDWIDKENGDADAFWEISKAEHCQTCLERHERWYPLKVRNWIIQMPQYGASQGRQMYEDATGHSRLMEYDGADDDIVSDLLAELKRQISLKGGPGSGNFGHAGRPGKVGGSAPESLSGSGHGMAMGETRDEDIPERVQAQLYKLISHSDDLSNRDVKLVVQTLGEVLEGQAKRLGIFPADLVDEIVVSSDAYGAAWVMTSKMTDKQLAMFGGQDNAIAAYEQDIRGCPGVFHPMTKTLALIIPQVGMGALPSEWTIHEYTRLRDVFTHELGHAVFGASKNKKASRQWRKEYESNPKFDRRTQYSRVGGADEAFAESYAIYIYGSRYKASDQFSSKYHSDDTDLKMVEDFLGVARKEAQKNNYKSGNYAHSGRLGIKGGSQPKPDDTPDFGEALKEHLSNSRLLVSRKSHSTKTHVVLYDVEASGDLGRWAAVCKEHEIVKRFYRRRVAESAMADPSSWCPECAKLKGGPGSGNFGHAGRPGKVGGSAPDRSGGIARGEADDHPLGKMEAGGQVGVEVSHDGMLGRSEIGATVGRYGFGGTRSFFSDFLRENGIAHDEDTPSAVKDNVCKIIVAEDPELTYDEVNAVLAGWASTSSKTMDAALLQEAASLEFGVPLNGYHKMVSIAEATKRVFAEKYRDQPRDVVVAVESYNELIREPGGSEDVVGKMFSFVRRVYPLYEKYAQSNHPVATVIGLLYADDLRRTVDYKRTKDSYKSKLRELLSAEIEYKNDPVRLRETKDKIDRTRYMISVFDELDTILESEDTAVLREQARELFLKPESVGLAKYSENSKNARLLSDVVFPAARYPSWTSFGEFIKVRDEVEKRGERAQSEIDSEHDIKISRLRRILRAMYNATQREFKKRGISFVYLMRGVTRQLGTNLSDVTAGKSFRYVGNAIESWTSSRGVASIFGHFLLFSKVPVSRILCTCLTGVGCFGEDEFVVFGSAGGEVTIADINSYKDVETLKGGPGSGNFGHAGRPGKIGGSAPQEGMGGAGVAMGETDNAFGLLEPLGEFSDEKISYAVGKAHLSGGKNEDVDDILIADMGGYGFITPSDIKDIVCKDIVKEDPSLGYGEVDYVLSIWASTSSKSEDAINLHEAASLEFGVPLHEFHKKQRDVIIDEDTESWLSSLGAKSGQDLVKSEASFRKRRKTEMKEKSDIDIPRYQKILRAMYNITQREFGKRGITHVVLARGVEKQIGVDYSSRRRRSFKYKGNAIESWSYRYSTAKSYGEKVVLARVPVSRILCTAITGMGCFREREIIIFGSAGGSVTLN